MKPKKGRFLISRPTLFDSTFNRTVILIVEHNEKGTVGFIINKPSSYALQDYVSDLHSDFQIYNGGPVEKQHIYYIHSRPDIITESVYIDNNLYWSGNFTDVVYGINNGFLQAKDIRFFIGYSGWGADQLEDELNKNAWTVKEDSTLNVLQDLGNDFWKKEMIRLGGENILWANSPSDLSLN